MVYTSKLWESSWAFSSLLRAFEFLSEVDLGTTLLKATYTEQHLFHSFIPCAVLFTKLVWYLSFVFLNYFYDYKMNTRSLSTLWKTQKNVEMRIESAPPSNNYQYNSLSFFPSIYSMHKHYSITTIVHIKFNFWIFKLMIASHFEYVSIIINFGTYFLMTAYYSFIQREHTLTFLIVGHLDFFSQIFCTVNTLW